MFVNFCTYEQFDGVKVEAKAELKGVPREDDYLKPANSERALTFGYSK